MSASYHPVWLFGTNAERLAWIAAHAGSEPGEEDGLGGIYWWETDTGALYIWDVDNGAWVGVGGGAWKLGNLIVLSDSGDGDFTTVAGAFGAAGVGDTILVDQGTYACAGETLPDEVALIGIDPVNCVLSTSATDVTLYIGSGCHVANLKIHNGYGVAAGYCLDVPNTVADIPTVRNLFLLQNAHTDGYCARVASNVNIDTCRMYSIDGGGVLMTATGVAYIFGGKIEADPSEYAVNNAAAGDVYLFGNPLLINGVNGTVDGQYVDETGLVHTLTAIDLEGVADALILDADGDTSISAPIDDQIDFEAANADQIHIIDGKLYPDADDDIDLGDATHEFKDAYFDGTIYADLVDLDGNADALVLSADGNDTISAPTNGQVDFEIGAADVAHLTAYGLSAQNHADIVKNSSGGAVVPGDVGYIDAAGEYVETTTAYADVSWCVVVKGGADAADIYVARRGRVTVYLNGNCSAGDYLYTSTTAGQAQPQTYVRPELFAVALTANGAGAGGTCEALLLCGRSMMMKNSSNDVFRVNASSSSAWSSTLNGAPVGAVVTYNTPLATGSEDSIVPVSATELCKLVLWNTTKTPDQYAFIDSVNTGANTITVSNAADVATWLNAENIQVTSTTVTSVGIASMYDLEIEDTSVIPETAVGLTMSQTILETGGAGYVYLHPYTTFSASSAFAGSSVTTGLNVREQTIGIINRRFCVSVNASGASTMTHLYRLEGYIAAVP